MKPNVEETGKQDIENVALKQVKDEDSFYGSLESTDTQSQDLVRYFMFIFSDCNMNEYSTKGERGLKKVQKDFFI